MHKATGNIQPRQPLSEQPLSPQPAPDQPILGRTLLWHKKSGIAEITDKSDTLDATEYVVCQLCAHHCRLHTGERGRCFVRFCVQTATGVELQSLVTERIASIKLDPVEKKPLYHFLPGTKTFSIGTSGCTFTCKFCQNWELAHGVREMHQECQKRQKCQKHNEYQLDTLIKEPQADGSKIVPVNIVAQALKYGAKSIAYTYNEPTVFWEYVCATAEKAQQAGLANVLVTNGFQSKQALQMVQHTVQAANVDLKAFSERFYQQICGGRLAPVLRNLRLMRKFGWWIEISTLLIPEYNDSMEEITAMGQFIANELGAETPWHLARFYPYAQMATHYPTPVEKLDVASQIGKKCGLHYVYVSNVSQHPAQSTYCPRCETLFAKRGGRDGYSVQFPQGGKCLTCNHSIVGFN